MGRVHLFFFDENSSITTSHADKPSYFETEKGKPETFMGILLYPSWEPTYPI